MTAFRLVTTVLLFVLVSHNVRCATVDRENPNTVISDDASEDLTDYELSTETEPQVMTTDKPIPTVRMPPSSDMKTEPKVAKSKLFSQTEQYYNGQAELWPPRLPADSQYDVLAAQAICHDTHVTLYLNFSSPFHGYIYPYHHFKRCHIFTGSGETDIKLVAENTSCGMDVAYSISKSNISFMEFTIMIQWDNEYLGQSDRKLRVTCNRPENDRRPVTFNVSHPIIVMEIEGESEDESVMSFSGNVTNNYDLVRLGEDIDVTFSVNAHSTGEKFDAQVIKCLAHDGLQDTDRKIATYSTSSENGEGVFTYDGSKLLLADGCPKSPEFFSSFDKQAKGNSVILNSKYKVFRFPSSSFVFLTCDVRICRDECPPQQDCHSKLKTEPAVASDDQKVVTLFRPLLVKLGTLGGGSSSEDLGNVGRSKSTKGLPTASFIAGLIGMGFVCAIVCIFMYRRFKKGTEKDYKMQYSPNAERNKDEVAPLKLTPAAAATD